ncbi:MAG TPA: MarR family transcriptional regulator [Acidimicrobiales bacterium]|nr:MarR family transcriptional regulator [Acidimicrobiales bacterium]
MGPRSPRPTEDTGDPPTTGQALYGLMTAAVRRGDRDMSLTSASTLATLDQTGPRRITDLAAVEGVAQPSMTVLVSALERSGLVARRVDPADRRVTLVSLTLAGADYLRRRRRAGAEAFDRLIDKLPPDEAGTLKAAMTALAHLRALDEEERDPGNRSDGGHTEADR